MMFLNDWKSARKTLEDGLDVVEAVVEGRNDFCVRDQSLVEDMRAALAWYEGMVKRLSGGRVVDAVAELTAQEEAIGELREKVRGLETSVEGLRGAHYRHDHELKNAVENMIHILERIGPCELWKPKDES